MMKSLLRLYPRSWRKRYGAEMEEVVDRSQGGIGVALDLVIGAAVAYRDVIAGNRILSAAAGCLHGLTVAVLVQAIGFVTLILFAQRSPNQTELKFGPLELLTAVPNNFFGLSGEALRSLALSSPYSGWLPEVVILTVLVLALGTVLVTPRLIRRSA